MSDKITELAKVIEKNISYDASGHTPEKRCPHCNEVIQKEEIYGYFLDHRGSLAQQIANYFGLGESFRETVEEKLQEVSVTGDKKRDSIAIANEILE